MIIYFADRKMNILGSASTELRKGFVIQDDLKTSEVDGGTTTFSFTIAFTDETRSIVEECLEAGNYVLRSNGDDSEFYTIIDEEIDTKSQTVEVYCEDAGMELLNGVALAFTAPAAYNIEWYFNKWLSGTGFTIRTNEYGRTNTRKLSWDSEQTTAERLASVATQFDNCEISYSFVVKGLTVANKYVNIYKKDGRGKLVHDQLRLNRDIDRIVTSKSVADLATALYVTGGVPSGKSNPITLSGHRYDDGDFYVDGVYLKSRVALKKWGRFPGYTNHIVKSYNYDTTNQTTLRNHAITALKKIRDTAINYEIDVSKLPEGIGIGDRIDIVDDAGGLYMQSRLLKLEESVCNDTAKATFGEYLIKTSGVAQRIEELATQFQELAANRSFYTWIAYADDDQGTGISLDPSGKEYMGTAANQPEDEPDITDPTIYTWAKIKGEDATGSLIAISISSSGGTLFKTTKISTTLTAHVYRNGVELNSTQIAEIGTLKWYLNGVEQARTGTTFPILESAGLSTATIAVQLEDEEE